MHVRESWYFIWNMIGKCVGFGWGWSDIIMCWANCEWAMVGKAITNGSSLPAVKCTFHGAAKANPAPVESLPAMFHWTEPCMLQFVGHKNEIEEKRKKRTSYNLSMFRCFRVSMPNLPLYKQKQHNINSHHWLMAITSIKEGRENTNWSMQFLISYIVLDVDS